MAADGDYQQNWAELVGYQHEVVHTGVLNALLTSDQGPELASELLGVPVTAVTGCAREKRLVNGGGKADLVARLTVDGNEEWLAVETKVHSDGSRHQLRKTTDNVGPSRGILLALGLTALKLSERDTQVVSAAGAPWVFVGPERWLDALTTIECESPWFEPYLESVRDWMAWLEGGYMAEAAELDWERDHLRYLAEVRSQLPTSWTEIRSLQSGPVFSNFRWTTPSGGDVYLEFMGLRGGRCVLCLKCGAKDRESLPQIRAEVEACQPELEAPFEPAGRAGGRSTTALQADLSRMTPANAAALAQSTSSVLDSNFVADEEGPATFTNPVLHPPS